jgi:hypothetical protein
MRPSKDAVDVTVEKVGPELFRVKTKSPLTAGEYAFVLNQPGIGMVWDFGVD